MTAAKKQRAGRVVRVSREVEQYLRRKRRASEGYDSILRRLFGLPKKNGDAQTLARYYVIENDGSPLIFVHEDEARGEAILLAARKKVRKNDSGFGKTERVLCMQELP